jgi:hypothetical protein
MDNLKPVVVEAEVMWAFLDTPNEMSGKYQVDLCNLSAKSVEDLKARGINVKNKEDKGDYVTAKSMNYPIKAELSDGTPVTCKIKNGSKAKATIKPYTWSWKGKTGVGTGIGKLVITNLIEYVEGGTPTEEDDSL